jgi:hypothetical protein
MEENTENRPRDILIGQQMFQQFIDKNAILVDKTKLIHQLITESPGPYFLSRPRRFGKTLLLDTIRSVFEGRKDLFTNLDIVKNDLMSDWEPFPLISFSFNGYPTDPEPLKDRMIFQMRQIAGIENLDLGLGEITQIADISKIIQSLSIRERSRRRVAGLKYNSYAPMNVVILIDEYDFPLLHNIHDDDKISDIRKILSVFYNAIKSCYLNIRFAFITGISKFDQLSLFSGFTNAQDISLGEKYSRICGFTDVEIKTYYGDHLVATLERMKKTTFFDHDATEDMLLAEIMKWYDGYSWDNVHRVLNPLSVSSFFSEQSFGKYWYESGPPIFTSLLTLKDDTYFKLFSKSFKMDSDLPLLSDIHDINNEAVLFQTGYLTIDSIDESAGTKQYALRPPNLEIGFSIVQEFIKKEGMLKKSSDTINVKYKGFIDAFDALDEAECSVSFASCMSEIILFFQVQIEFVPQVLMYTLLNLKYPCATMEKNIGDGRADLFYTSPKGHVIVVEIKFRKKQSISVKSPQSAKFQQNGILTMDCENLDNSPSLDEIEILEKGISDAFDQIDSRNYTLPLYKSSNKIYAAAVSIYGSSRAMFRFREETWEKFRK